MPCRTDRRAARACAHVLLYFALAVGLVSCATVNASSTQYVGAPRFPPTDPARVAILRSEPTRPHVRLGEIAIDASVDPAPSVEQVEQKLKVDGGQLGADAVVVVVDRLQRMGSYVSGPWWGRSVEGIEGRKVIGVAIRYTGGS